MAASTITIKTRLNDGIYASQGGGEVRTHYTYSTGPRNLLSAIKQLREHQKEIEQGYGNIGCGSSWMEINGKEVSQMDLDNVTFDDKDMYSRDEWRFASTKTTTQKAKELIASFQ